MKKYSLVAYLVGNDLKEVKELQEDISNVTGSTWCLTEWIPHITLADTLILSDQQLAHVEEVLKGIAAETKAFDIRITTCGGTTAWGGAVSGETTPYAHWLDVEVTTELATLHKTLQEKVTSSYSSWLPKSKSFSPHITIAFADLDENGYKKGVDYLKSRTVARIASVSNIALVECYGKGNMQSREYRRFELLKAI